jgi:predicted nuclease of predicted toxin-antitoxin system
VRFLADESRDFAVVDALREAGYDVAAVVDTHPGAEDETVLALARSEARILVEMVAKFGERLTTAFAVVVPGRARLSRPPSASN